MVAAPPRNIIGTSTFCKIQTCFKLRVTIFHIFTQSNIFGPQFTCSPTKGNNFITKCARVLELLETSPGGSHEAKHHTGHPRDHTTMLQKRHTESSCCVNQRPYAVAKGKQPTTPDEQPTTSWKQLTTSQRTTPPHTKTPAPQDPAPKRHTWPKHPNRPGPRHRPPPPGLNILAGRGPNTAGPKQGGGQGGGHGGGHRGGQGGGGQRSGGGNTHACTHHQRVQTSCHVQIPTL